MQIISDLVGTGVSFASQNGRSASNIKTRAKNDRFRTYRFIAHMNVFQGSSKAPTPTSVV